jgi:hypothetical protein
MMFQNKAGMFEEKKKPEEGTKRSRP